MKKRRAEDFIDCHGEPKTSQEKLQKEITTCHIPQGHPVVPPKVLKSDRTAINQIRLHISWEVDGMISKVPTYYSIIF